MMHDHTNKLCQQLHGKQKCLQSVSGHVQRDNNNNNAVENLGAFSLSTLEFLSDLDHKLSSFSGEERASSFLFQRLSVSLQHFISVLLHDTCVIHNVPDQ